MIRKMASGSTSFLISDRKRSRRESLRKNNSELEKHRSSYPAKGSNKLPHNFAIQDNDWNPKNKHLTPALMTTTAASASGMHREARRRTPYPILIARRKVLVQNELACSR